MFARHQCLTYGLFAKHTGGTYDQARGCTPRPKYDYRLPRGPSCITTLPPEGVVVLVTPLTTGYVHISLRCVAALLRQAAQKGKYDDVFSLLEEHKSIRIDAVRLGGSGKTALYIAVNEAIFMCVC